MLRAQFRLELPPGEWVSEVSRQYPGTTFRLLTGLQTGETAVELGEMLTDAPEQVSETIATHDAISQYVELALADRKLVVKYETDNTGLYSFAEELGVPLEFPIVVQDGWYDFELTGTRAEFDRIRDRLDDADCRFELVSVVEMDTDSDLLTDRQQEVLTAAVRRGYFAVPRECTLSDLAAQFDADESTLSGVVRRGAARVLTSHLTSVDGLDS